jgi:hypothetical protein
MPTGAGAAGREIPLSRQVVVTVTRPDTLPSVGFIVWQRQRLKPAYQGLAGEQIRDLRLQGVEVTDEVRHALVAYLGDSAPEGLDQSPAMYQAQILICEITFLAPSHRKDRIHKLGHIHLDDIVARRALFQNQLVIAAHFSTRYHRRQIDRHVAYGSARYAGWAAAAMALAEHVPFARVDGFVIRPRGWPTFTCPFVPLRLLQLHRLGGPVRPGQQIPGGDRARLTWLQEPREVDTLTSAEERPLSCPRSNFSTWVVAELVPLAAAYEFTVSQPGRSDG